MVTTYLSGETRSLLLRHQKAQERYEAVDWDRPDWEAICDEYWNSVKELQLCDDPEIRKLASRIGYMADPSISDEDMQRVRDAEHDLIRVSLQVADQRPSYIKSHLN